MKTPILDLEVAVSVTVVVVDIVGAKNESGMKLGAQCGVDLKRPAEKEGAGKDYTAGKSL